MLRLVVFLALLAGVVYASFWLLEQRGKLRGRGGGRKQIPPRPVGPDDDEEFLRELEWRRRRERGGSGRGDAAAPPGSNGKPSSGPTKGTPPAPPPHTGTPPPTAGGASEAEAPGKPERPVRDEATHDEEP